MVVWSHLCMYVCIIIIIVIIIIIIIITIIIIIIIIVTIIVVMLDNAGWLNLNSLDVREGQKKTFCILELCLTSGSQFSTG